MNSPFVINVTEADFQFEVIDYSQETPVIVDFWAEWCVPCKMLDPILQKLAKERKGDFRLAKVNVDENQNLAMRFNIRGIPAVKAFREAVVVSEFSGIKSEPQIRDFLRDIIPTTLDLNLEKAKSLLNMGDWEQANETFRQVLAERPGHAKALLGLAKSIIALGDGSKARDILNAIPIGLEFSIARKLQPLALALSRIESGIPDSDSQIETTYNHALRLISIGNFPAAIDGILDILRQDKSYRNGEAKQVILAIFEILGNESPVVRQYQAELASILF